MPIRCSTRIGFYGDHSCLTFVSCKTSPLTCIGSFGNLYSPPGQILNENDLPNSELPALYADDA
jgi:hypothetical protein